MPYSQTTFADLQTQLSAALGDPDQRFWTLTETEILLREALSTWAVMSAYWRKTRIFNTSSVNYLYDLVTEGIVSAAPNLGALINQLQFSLMEPYSAVTGLPFVTTEMFTDDEIYSALIRAVAQFNFDTGVRLTKEADLPLPPAGDYQFDLPVGTCDVRRLVIRRADGTRFRIDRQDEYESQYRSAPEDLFFMGSPFSYSFILARQPGVRLVYPVSIVGMVEAITIHSDSLPPVDLQWPIKWLALHFLLSQDGQSRDHARAQYARMRYREGIILARMLPSYLVGYVNNRPVPISPISDEDKWNPTWMDSTPTTPTGMVSLGWNLLGFSPRPSGIASVRLDGVIESQIPSPTSGFVQVAEEHLQAILGYAQHIALFKLGGKEFFDSIHFYEHFVEAAMEYNQKLLVESKNFPLMMVKAARDKEMRIARREPLVSQTEPGSGSQIQGG